VRFSELFAAAMSRTEVVVTFLAILELIRLKQLVCIQEETFGEIDITKALPPAEPAPAEIPATTEAELPPANEPASGT
jgi:segregation and condensation protein A